VIAEGVDLEISKNVPGAEIEEKGAEVEAAVAVKAETDIDVITTADSAENVVLNLQFISCVVIAKSLRKE